MVPGPARQPELGAQVLGNNSLGMRIGEPPSAPHPSLPPAQPSPQLPAPTPHPSPSSRPAEASCRGWWAPAPHLTASLPLTWALGKVLGAFISCLPGPELHRVAAPEQRGAVGLVQLCKGRGGS